MSFGKTVPVISATFAAPAGKGFSVLVTWSAIDADIRAGNVRYVLHFNEQEIEYQVLYLISVHEFFTFYMKAHSFKCSIGF